MLYARSSAFQPACSGDWIVTATCTPRMDAVLLPSFWYAVLLQQIMQLSPAQIEGLPPEQKAQVLALQQQMVRGMTCKFSGLFCVSNKGHVTSCLRSPSMPADADNVTQMCFMLLPESFVTHSIPACNGCHAIAESCVSGMVSLCCQTHM